MHIILENVTRRQHFVVIFHRYLFHPCGSFHGTLKYHKIGTKLAKLINLGVRPALISWMCSFLFKQQQAVKINDIISSWLPITAGVPQGTKLGPILFLLMLNDLGLSTQLGCNHWKYVDDITLSDTLLRGQSSCLQSDLDRIHQWAVDNNMRLNPSKCKIMLMCFFFFFFPSYRN